MPLVSRFLCTRGVESRPAPDKKLDCDVNLIDSFRGKVVISFYQNPMFQIVVIVLCLVGWESF